MIVLELKQMKEVRNTCTAYVLDQRSRKTFLRSYSWKPEAVASQTDGTWLLLQAQYKSLNQAKMSAFYLYCLSVLSPKMSCFLMLSDAFARDTSLQTLHSN